MTDLTVSDLRVSDLIRDWTLPWIVSDFEVSDLEVSDLMWDWTLFG